MGPPELRDPRPEWPAPCLLHRRSTRPGTLRANDDERLRPPGAQLRAEPAVGLGGDRVPGRRQGVPGRDRGGARRLVHAAPRRVPLGRRPVGLRQVDAAPDGVRPRPAHLGRGRQPGRRTSATSSRTRRCCRGGRCRRTSSCSRSSRGRRRRSAGAGRCRGDQARRSRRASRTTTRRRSRAACACARRSHAR